MKRLSFVFACGAVLLVAISGLGLRGQTAPPADVAVQSDVMIVARDAIRLATDIYRPTRGGIPTAERLPILLHRTPYSKTDPRIVALARYFAQHGYAVAVQDTRGNYKSEGVFSKYYAFDSTDGFDTIAWLAAQKWSNGLIGMWGTSYAAHTQADAAKLNPPAMGALILNMGGMSNAWDHAVRHGGAFELGRELTWAWRQIGEKTTDPVVKQHLEKETLPEWYAALPFRPGLSPLAIAPNYERYFIEEMTHSDYDDFWKSIALNWKEYYAQTADVPMMHIGGWFDIFLRGTIENYVSLSKIKKSPMRLLIGPWTHGGDARTYAGDVEFGAAAAIPDFATTFHLEWFDRYLKRTAGAGTTDAPVRVFVMGTGDGHKDANGRIAHGGAWRTADTWPLPGAVATTYYLHADGSLSTAAPTTQEESITYTFDPRHPVPTIGGNVSNRLKDGAYDQRERVDFYGSQPPYLPLRARSDVLVFQTSPLPADVTVIGPITVKLFASSTAVDTDFTAKLVDVYPPSRDYPTGFDMNITDALVRARYRGDRTTQELIRPGQIYEMVIRPFPTANVFKRGHRIRVDISSSNFPRFDVNPNTGEPLGRNRRLVAADNTIYVSQAYASQVVLPVMAPGR